MFRNKKEKRWFGMIVAIVVCLVVVGAVRADWSEQTKLTAPDADDTKDYFGCAVSIDGDYAIVGSDFDSVNEAWSGSAYIFKREGESWTQQAQLTASDANAADRLGNSVCIYGDYAIVGMERSNANGLVDSGAAYIFKKPPGGWVDTTEIAKLTSADPNERDYFGCSVSISGDYAIVGVKDDDDNGEDSGSAYIFKRSDIPSDPNWYQVAKLLASDGSSDDGFGYAVSISGDYAIVGAPWDSPEDGTAYIFEKPVGGWMDTTETVKLDCDWTGYAVSVSGDCAIVGWGGRAAYIFQRSDVPSDPNWYQQAELTPSDPNSELPGHSRTFGDSVCISGNYAIVGRFWDDERAPFAGSVYIYEQPLGGWADANETVKLIASDVATEDKFGYSVSVSGNYAIAGAPLHDEIEPDAGSAYVFKREVICAEWLTADLSGDCFVDFRDLSIFTKQWLKCGDPYDPNCQP